MEWEVLEYLDAAGGSPFRRWFDRLDAGVAARITMMVARFTCGNLGHLRSLGGGLLESKLDFGPGYRIYLGRDGDRIIILPGGGTKRGQDRDIAMARVRWDDYRARRQRT